MGLTEAFHQRFASGEPLDELLPEAFAAVREAAKRTLGMRHFDVQIIGGAVLHDGKIAEMATGEGKTLVATLATYLNAVAGRGVHVVTVNDYLAKRDAQWMGPVYAALGAGVGCLQHDAALLFDSEASEENGGPMRPAHRREAYAAHITYGTNAEFGFDYLRDNMALDLEQKVQRELTFAIVDEVDYILIDEARTPLIISGAAQEPSQSYQRFAQLARGLREDEDFAIDGRTKAVTLTEPGLAKVERVLGVGNLYDPEHYSLVHFMEQALKAEANFERDKEYVVTNEAQVVIVDEFTGPADAGPAVLRRPAPGHRGQGERDDPAGVRDAGDDHAAELLPHVREAGGHDGNGGHRGGGTVQDLHARCGCHSDEPADGPR